MSGIEDALDKLKQKSKIVNEQKKKGLNSFFLVGDQSYTGSSSNKDTAQSEPLKNQRKDRTVDISVETSKTKD